MEIILFIFGMEWKFNTLVSYLG